MFVDRELELGLLDKAYNSRPLLVVVYGRRRVGKTRLVLEWVRRMGVDYVYYHAVPAAHEVNLRGLGGSIARDLGLGVFERARFEGLDVLLEALARVRGDVVVVLDEFTYWVRGEPRVVGELQRFVDHVLPSTRMLVIVVGSLLGVMLRGVLGGGAPLYGRARVHLRVEPLKPWYVTVFHPWLRLEDAVRVYGLFGGIPYYHSMILEGESLEDIVERLVVSPHTPLRDELLFMLRDELQNPAPYYSVLEAVARGYTRLSEIAGYTGIPVQHLPRYLSTLELLGLVERVTPLGSKRGWYRVRDPIARTWFRIVEPLIPLIESGSTRRAVSHALEALEMLMGEVFEEVAVEYVKHLASVGRLSYTGIGRWARRGVEIDLLAVDEENRVVHAFEVKWAELSGAEARRLARRLEAKLLETPYRDWSHRLHIICRSYQGEPPDGVAVHTLQDMPFKREKSPQQ